jgi:meromycolic acid enoyl-[acyl-carrier-protein] reductase
VNLVAAGPIQTLAAGAIPGFDELAENWRCGAPLDWDMADPSPIAETICFLLSERARAITAEIVHVDGGYHAMGAPIR